MLLLTNDFPPRRGGIQSYLESLVGELLGRGSHELTVYAPKWKGAPEYDKAAAAATRKKVFDMLASDKVAFLGYHMPFPAVGFVEKQDTGYRFVPKSYQFDL